jgi:hypothetical protein
MWTPATSTAAAGGRLGQSADRQEVIAVRPRLKPALRRLWRDRSCVQLGVDAQHAVILEGICDAAGTVLDLLDGERDWSEVLATAATRGCDPDDAAALLHLLFTHGALDDAAAWPAGIPVDELDRLAPDHAHASLVAPEPGSGAGTLLRRNAARAVVVGAGRVGASIAGLLCAAGVGDLTVCDTAVSGPADASPAGFPPTADGTTRATATASAASQVGAGRVTAGRLDIDNPRLYAGADVVVLAPDVYAGPAPPLRAALTATGSPYLLAGVRETRGIVGPLVLPGVTSCARCHDLLRADRDPGWPVIAAQLVNSRPTAGQACDVVLATAVAAVAAGQVQDLLDGRSVATLGATLEIPLPEWRLHRRSWRTHPDCGCTTSVAS